MNNFLILAFLFFIGCFLGWGLEVLYRRFSPANVSRRWINPGFLVGPYLPLYGFGLCALYLLPSGGKASEGPICILCQHLLWLGGEQVPGNDIV